MFKFLKSWATTSDSGYTVEESLSNNLVDPQNLKAVNPTKHKKKDIVYFVESGIVSHIYTKDGKKVYRVAFNDNMGEIELNFYGNSLMTESYYQNMFTNNQIHVFDWFIKPNNDDKPNNGPYAYMRQDYSDIEENLIDPNNNKVREHKKGDKVYFIRRGVVNNIGEDLGNNEKVYEVKVVYGDESIELKYFYGNHLMTKAEYIDKFFGIPKPTKVGGSRRRKHNKSRSRRHKKSTRRRHRKH